MTTTRWLLLVTFAAMMAFASGCATAGPGARVRGIDLYAHVTELRDQGQSIVASTREPVTVRRGQYLVDPDLQQVFEVNQVIAGCKGGDILADDKCTLALLGRQSFTIHDQAPAQAKSPDAEGSDLTGRQKALIFTGLTSTALFVGAAKCDAFDGCGAVLGVAGGLDALIFLLLLGGGHD